MKEAAGYQPMILKTTTERQDLQKNKFPLKRITIRKKVEKNNDATVNIFKGGGSLKTQPVSKMFIGDIHCISSSV